MICRYKTKTNIHTVDNSTCDECVSRWSLAVCWALAHNQTLLEHTLAPPSLSLGPRYLSSSSLLSSETLFHARLTCTLICRHAVCLSSSGDACRSWMKWYPFVSTTRAVNMHRYWIGTQRSNRQCLHFLFQEKAPWDRASTQWNEETRLHSVCSLVDTFATEQDSLVGRRWASADERLLRELVAWCGYTPLQGPAHVATYTRSFLLSDRGCVMVSHLKSCCEVKLLAQLWPWGPGSLCSFGLRCRSSSVGSWWESQSDVQRHR